MTTSNSNKAQIQQAAVIFASEHSWQFAFHGNQWWEFNPYLKVWGRDGAYDNLQLYVSRMGEFLHPHLFPWVLARLDQAWTQRQIVARASRLLTVPGLPGPGWTRATPTEYPPGSQD